jgi:glycosyltransferase involved in cell wall biosynthesis
MKRGAGGLVVPRDDPDALARGVLDLLERPELRRDMSRRTRACVEASFSWPRVAEATVAVYREVLAG